MSGHRSLATSSAQLLAIRTSRVAMQLAVMALTARQFGAAEAGEFALALAMTAPVFVVLDLGLRTLYLSRSPRPAYAQLLGVRGVATVIALVVCAGITLFRPDMAVVLLVVAANKSAELLLELAIGPLQLVGALRRATVVTVVASATTVVVYLVAAPWDFVPSLAAALLSGATVLAVGSLGLGRHAAREAEEGEARRGPSRGLVRDGLALGVGNGIVSLATSVPQLFLAAAFSTVVSGRYAVMLYVVLAGEMLMNAVSQSVLPQVADRTGREGGAALRAWASRWTRLGTVGAIPVAVLGVLVASVVIPWIMGRVYTFTWPEAGILVLMLVLLPGLFVGSVALQARNDYRTTALISLGTLVVVTAASGLLVPALAAAGALLSATAGTLTRVVLARRRWAGSAAPGAEGGPWSSR